MQHGDHREQAPDLHAKLFEIPENPGSRVIFAVTLKEIPKVDPFPVAIALIMDIAPNTVAVLVSFFNLFWFTKNSKQSFFHYIDWCIHICPYFERLCCLMN